jgi:hypothetical protein
MNLLQEKYQDLCDIGKEWKLPAVGKTVDEWVKIVEGLTREHNGVLPSQKWLKENGHYDLVSAIRRYPERFAHIKQESLKGKTVEEHVADAEKLARNHDGVLPYQAWLNKHGHSGLTQMIQSHPERFAHIKQEKFQKTIEEHIADADKLAKKHNGILPERKWLKVNGYCGLVAMICKYPERFAHIKRKKFFKTIEEHVADVKNLTREYDGILPSQAWLQKHSHSGLAAVIRNHPERFTHVKQEKLIKILEEHVADADKLAREYNGVLPNQKWLKGNGYIGLAAMIWRHPERFAHIKQNSLKGKAIEEYIADAEGLAKKHDGVLPGQGWLQEHGYDGLSAMIWRHPERFAHIKQEKLYKTVEERVTEAEKLAREYDGILPSWKWLKEHGYGGLASALYRCPEMFAHIKRMIRSSLQEKRHQ